MVLETRADADGITWLLGTPAEHVRWVQRTLRDLLPGITIMAADAAGRAPVESALALQATPRVLGLGQPPLEVTTALLSALSAHLSAGEVMVLQIVLGPRIAGRIARGPVADPAQPIGSLLARGVMPAPASVQRAIAERVALHGFRVSLRIAATASTTERRRRMILGIFGALGRARPAGVRLSLTAQRPDAITEPRLPRRWPLSLTPDELTGLLAWPLGEHDLPGVPPLHPRQLLPVRTPTPEGRDMGETALPGSGIRVGVNATDALMHQVLLGPTGSGKSNVLLLQIAADIRAGRPLLVIDPKQQLIDDILDHAVGDDRVDDVVIISLADPHVPGFNPLDAGDRDPDVVVDSLLAVFKAVFADGWGPRTEDIFLASLLTLVRAGQAIGTPFTLVDLPRLLTEESFRLRLIGHVAGDPTLAGFWATYGELSPAAQAAMIAAPLNKLRRYLMRPAVRRMLGQAEPSFRLRDIFRDNKIVLVPLNEGLIGPVTAQLVGSLIVAEAWNATQERAGEDRPTDRPGFVVVDECQRFVNLPTSFGDALSQSRSYGVGWILAHQSRAQLPAELRESIDTNARSKIFFRLESSKDASDAAKLTHGHLAAEDFQQLPRHTAYARIVTDGESSGWTMIATLAPPPPTGLANLIRTASRDRYGSASSPAPSPILTTPDRGNVSPVGTPPAPTVGRKRRQKKGDRTPEAEQAEGGQK
ncbi:type IV secretory system conjugative DNA transfer family protein [Gordonia sp. N1V]|uniref:type IV secretory system conjugative DNA transfer family protein n=1 Tax=Gordonia sp. N1V TaxID=3034163 RepID=UPI0023E29ADF|nr:type IV secretory system conjugative DNA transfer family protein [Gordonia sp. N1V]MDF3284955.1 TraM recognition domain-containing protein [Gordonia sp. N1V]